MTAHARPTTTLVTSLVGIATISCGALVKPTYQLRYNASDSAPRGWYVLVPQDDIRVGALVFARLPSRASRLAVERGYLPRTVPILKRVAATSGHRVCTLDTMIAIDGVLVGYALTRDGLGRVLEPWAGCRALGEDELFLFSGHSPASFDSRYFGPVNAVAVLGKAIPIWTW